CDAQGDDLEPGTLPPQWEERTPDDYSPFQSRAQFELEYFLYVEDEMPGERINKLTTILAQLYGDADSGFIDQTDLYSTIDAIPQGSVPWQSFTISYNPPNDEGCDAPWKRAMYEVWHRNVLHVMENQIQNCDFAGQID
ncbi:hypothetical protein PAXRUDRAFT_160769, partial [Paxillus rubicundulus Ve08.2h10]